MKIKSLLLGSVAAAGLSTSAFAADLGVVLTSLDVCDSLGISGLTISSDTNCLKITGGVSYEFQWGDYTSTGLSAFMRDAGTVSASAGDDVYDWESHVEAWLQFEGSASSSFGTARAVIKLLYEDDYTMDSESTATTVTNTTTTSPDVTPLLHTASSSLGVDEAYVAIGDTTILSAGKKGSIANFDDDEPFNFLGLFGSDHVDAGVGETGDDGAFGGNDLMDDTGGHVIQIVSDLGNGVSVGAALENLDGSAEDSEAEDGTFVGVLAYAGDGITAHATFLAGGVLDGTVENWAIHSGFTGEFDMFKVRGAGYFDSNEEWNVLASAEATFDMFTIAGSVEAAEHHVGSDIEFGAGGSISAAVTDGVTINLGGRWYDRDTGTAETEVWEAQAQLVAALTETLTATGTVGMLGENVGADDSVIYFEGELAWAPGGGFESAIGAGGNDDGAMWVNFTASKDFE